MKFLDHLEEWLIISLMGFATLIIFFSVLHRYISGIEIPIIQDWFLKQNIGWAQELTIYMFVWMAKFGAAFGVRTGIHVGVDILINNLNKNTQRIFIIFGLLAGASFTSIVALIGLEFVIELSKTSSTSEVMEIPIWIVYLAIPLGSFLMSYRFIEVAWTYYKNGKLPDKNKIYDKFNFKKKIEKKQK